MSFFFFSDYGISKLEGSLSEDQLAFIKSVQFSRLKLAFKFYEKFATGNVEFSIIFSQENFSIVERKLGCWLGGSPGCSLSSWWSQHLGPVWFDMFLWFPTSSSSLPSLPIPPLFFLGGGGSVLPACMCVPGTHEARRTLDHLEVQLQMWMWEPNRDPLQEQQVPLTDEQSFQSLPLLV